MEKKPPPWWERMGIVPGVCLIGYGLISAVYGYFQDMDSMDRFAKDFAVQGAILHAALFVLGGLAVIGWSRLRGPQEKIEPPEE